MKQERRLGGDCYHTIYVTFKMKFQSYFMPMVGVMSIAPYGFFLLIHDIDSVNLRFSLC